MGLSSETQTSQAKGIRVESQGCKQSHSGLVSAQGLRDYDLLHFTDGLGLGPSERTNLIPEALNHSTKTIRQEF